MAGIHSSENKAGTLLLKSAYLEIDRVHGYSTEINLGGHSKINQSDSRLTWESSPMICTLTRE